MALGVYDTKKKAVNRPFFVPFVKHLFFFFFENTFQRSRIQRCQIKAHTSFIQQIVQTFLRVGVFLFVDIFGCFANKFALRNNSRHMLSSFASPRMTPVCQDSHGLGQKNGRSTILRWEKNVKGTGKNIACRHKKRCLVCLGTTLL